MRLTITDKDGTVVGHAKRGKRVKLPSGSFLSPPGPGEHGEFMFTETPTAAKVVQVDETEITRFQALVMLERWGLTAAADRAASKLSAVDKIRFDTKPTWTENDTTLVSLLLSLRSAGGAYLTAEDVDDFFYEASGIQ